MEGVFTKCRKCGQPIYEKELAARFNVCPNCEFHYPLSAKQRVRLLMEPGTFRELDAGMKAANPLEFEGYPERLEKARRNTDLDDAILSGVGEVGDTKVAFAAMDFGFVGGSMGSVVGERIARTMELAYSEELPLWIASASGGARKYEGV